MPVVIVRRMKANSKSDNQKIVTQEELKQELQVGKNRRDPRKDCFEIELVLQSFETKISMNMERNS